MLLSRLDAHCAQNATTKAVNIKERCHTYRPRPKKHCYVKL